MTSSSRWSWIVTGLVTVSFAAFGGDHLIAQELTHEKLQSIVRRAMESSPDVVQLPQFRIDADAMYYDFGHVNRPTLAQNPIHFPVDGQFRIEMLRQYPWRTANRKIWDRQLARAEAIIKEELKAIAAHKGKEDKLFSMLQEHDAQIEKLFLQAAQEMANREQRLLVPVGTVFRWELERTPSGYRWVRRQERRVEHYRKGFAVELKCSPDGAHMFYLTEFDYETAKERGVLGADSTWLRIDEGSHVLGGLIYFRARWPIEGKSAQPARWRITNDGKITLTPD